jgi:hypothetical protein
MLVKVKGVSSGWSALYLVSALLLVISCFGFHLYQTLTVNSRPSPYDFRQLGATASASTPLSILVVFVSFGPVILFACLAWETVPNLSDLTYRFLSLVAWMLAMLGVLVCGFALYSARYIQKNGFIPPSLLGAATRANANSTLVGTVVQLSMIGAATYFLATNIDTVPSEILEQVLLLGGGIAIVPPCIEVILSSVHAQGRLSLLSTLERDILMHDLPVEEIRTRLENDLIGSELGDWAKRRVEKIRAAHNEITGFCEEVGVTLQQVEALDVSLKFERKGRLNQCVTRLDSLIDELNSCWEPLNSWLSSCKTQPFRDPYITRVVQGTLDDLSPLMQSAVQAARSSLATLKARIKEIE